LPFDCSPKATGASSYLAAQLLGDLAGVVAGHPHARLRSLLGGGGAGEGAAGEHHAGQNKAQSTHRDLLVGRRGPLAAHRHFAMHRLPEG
jgi:hypothetical protein